MSSIITEHRYEAARWGDTAYNAILSGKFLPGEIIDLHNATIIKLQGDHDEECERLRHQLADASQALTYSRQGKEAADATIRRMSETIREQSARIKTLESQIPKVVKPVKGTCPLCGNYNHIFGVNKTYCGGCGVKLNWEEK